MPRPKSLLPKLEIDMAQHAHNCQHNPNHRIQKGEKRLKVPVGRSYEHFCKDCAIKIINDDIKELKELALEIGGSDS